MVSFSSSFRIHLLTNVKKSLYLFVCFYNLTGFALCLEKLVMETDETCPLHEHFYLPVHIIILYFSRTKKQE